MSRLFATGGDRCGWPQALLFDLDGTLIDSAADIAAATNRLLASEQHSPLEVAEVRSMIGNGVGKLVERAFAARGVRLEGEAHVSMTARMMGFYADHLTGHTTLLGGAAEMLEAYHGAGVRNAIVTNKPEAFTRTILDHFGLSRFVAVVVGGDTGPARKPAPDMLLHAASEAGIRPDRAIMVGDSAADIGAAKAAGMASVAVRGGYTAVPAEELGADAVIATLFELPRAIEALKEPA